MVDCASAPDQFSLGIADHANQGESIGILFLSDDFLT
jgi:hypothetical protein